MADISFTKVDLPYGWLGNMATYPIEYEGQIWITSEALFQSLRFDNAEIRELIREQTSPMSAKMKAKALRYREYRIIEPMSERDIANMRLCLRLKFEQHTELKGRLLRTAPHTLVEDIGTRRGLRHQFWGAYRDVNNQWVGQNMMGQLLMEVRNALQNPDSRPAQ